MRWLWTVVSVAVRAFIADDALSRGAAIAYYAVFALAPILVIVIAVAGLVFGDAPAQNAIIAEFSSLMGIEAAALLQQMVHGAADTKAGIASGIFGVTALLLTATGVFTEMQSALNLIWRAEPEHSPLSVLLRARLISLGLILALGFILIASLIASAALTSLGSYLKDVFPALPALLAGLDLILSLALISLLIGAIYKFLPNTPIEWSDVAVGAFLTACLLTMGKWLIGFYVGRNAAASTYGAASAFVVILLWVYYCAQIFLLGAEVTYAYAQQRRGRASLPAELPTAGRG